MRQIEIKCFVENFNIDKEDIMCNGISIFMLIKKSKKVAPACLINKNVNWPDLCINYIYVISVSALLPLSVCVCELFFKQLSSAVIAS